MRNFFIYLLAVLAVFAGALGAGCDFEGKHLKVGETYNPIGQCMGVTCRANDQISMIGCGLVAALKPCPISEDLSKPYPQCCPVFKCRS